MSTEYSKSQLNYRRSKGVNLAWKREQELVSKGRGTRDWSVKEQKELLRNGRVKGYQGHHNLSVAAHPQYADDPKNIQFLSVRKDNNEHLKAHKGDYRNESDGRYNVKTGKIREMPEGKPRAMYSRELKDKAIEKRGYTKYAEGNASAQKNKSAAAPGKSNAAKSTSYNGKTYNRAFVKSGGSAGQSSTKSSTKSGTETKNARYGEKSAKAAGRQSTTRTGGYGKKASRSGTASGSGHKSSYGSSRAASSGKSKSASSGRSASASSGRHSGGSSQKR